MRLFDEVEECKKCKWKWEMSKEHCKKCEHNPDNKQKEKKGEIDNFKELGGKK